MKKSQEFNNILNECLERLLKGESIEQCLLRYPEQTDELEPLLLTAQVTKQASAIQPRPEFRARARYQFRSELRQAESRRGRPFFAWQPRWATAVIVVMVLVLVGGGTVLAAGNSMPDSPLYQVKLATEQVRLRLTPSDLGKARLYAQLADKRVVEIARMAREDKLEQVERASRRLDTSLVMIVRLVSAQREEAGALMAPPPQKALAPSPAAREDEGIPPREEAPLPPRLTTERTRLRAALAEYAVRHPEALRAALARAPESVRPALRRAIARSVAEYRRALESLD